MGNMIDVSECFDYETKEEVDIRLINSDLILTLGKDRECEFTIITFRDGSKILTKESIKTLGARISLSGGKE